MPLLAWAVLTAAACQSREHAPFHDPSRLFGDGGQFPTDGADSGSRRGDGGLLTGEPTPGITSGRPEPTDFAQYGSPLFDPEQVYLQGYFRGSEFVVDVQAGLCSDGAGAIGDWSYPKQDWSTPNGITVAIPCDTEDVQVRADGSVVYGYDTFGPRAFVEEPPTIDGESIVIPFQAPEANVADPTINPCVGVGGFQSFMLHPRTGAMAANCHTENGIVHPLLGTSARKMTVLEIPGDLAIVHLGYGDVALLRRPNTQELAVWTDAGKVVELGKAPFKVETIAAVRAELDAFALLVATHEDPPELERWKVSYDGKLAQDPDDYPAASDVVLDVSECVPRDGLGWSLADPTFNPNYLATLGCVCALEPGGVALCIARDATDDSVVLRFEPGQGEVVEVFRLSDQDPHFLTKLKGLITGS